MAFSRARFSREASLSWAEDLACAVTASLHVLACAGATANSPAAAMASAANLSVERMVHPSPIRFTLRGRSTTLRTAKQERSGDRDYCGVSRHVPSAAL